MTYVIRNTLIGGQAIASTSTTKNHPLGTIVVADDPTYGAGEFIYLLGVASTAVGSWASYNPDDGSTALLAANASGDVAVSMSANVASQYGWYQIKGKAIGKALASFLDNAEVYATSTAGSVDDAVVSGDKVYNAKGASAVDTPSTGLAEFEISRPYVRNGLLVDSTELTATTAELNTLSGVTSSAAEINKLDGLTATVGELNYVSTLTAGTVAASRAVVVDANKDVGTLRNVTLSTVVLATASTLTALATAATLGTVTASVQEIIAFLQAKMGAS